MAVIRGIGWNKEEGPIGKSLGQIEEAMDDACERHIRKSKHSKTAEGVQPTLTGILHFEEEYYVKFICEKPISSK